MLNTILIKQKQVFSFLSAINHTLTEKKFTPKKAVEKAPHCSGAVMFKEINPVFRIISFFVQVWFALVKTGETYFFL